MKHQNVFAAAQAFTAQSRSPLPLGRTPTRAIAAVRAEVSTAPRVIAGRNPPAPHTTPRRTRGAFALTDLTLRIQQTLEALDIFRAAARLPIIHVTEMLHQ